MKNLTHILFITSFGLTTLIYSQNYGYDQNQQYQNRQQSYQMNNPNYPSQQGYSQGQPQYNDDRNMNRNQYDQRYDSQRSNTYGATATNKPAEESSWSNWLGKDDKTPVVADEVVSSKVVQNLRSTPYFSSGAKNIEVSTKDGKVTLKGKVFNKNEKNQIDYMVKNVEGVKSVSNDLDTEK